MVLLSPSSLFFPLAIESPRAVEIDRGWKLKLGEKRGRCCVLENRKVSENSFLSSINKGGSYEEKAILGTILGMEISRSFHTG